MSRLRALCLTALVVLATACAPPGLPPARYALVYGVSRYVEAAEGVFPNLTYSDDDARSIAALLEADGYAVTLRVDQEASRENLEADLSFLAATALREDLVLVYFSGHGGLLSDFGLDPEAVATYPPDSQWILLHGAIDPTFTGRFLLPGDIFPQRAVSDLDLQGLMEDLPCSRKLVIIDACNSGGFIEKGADVDALPPDYSRLVRVDRTLVFARAVRAYLTYAFLPADTRLAASTALVLAAAGAGEPSYEYAPLGHGVFTYFLLEAAALGDLNGDGLVTALEAYAYVAAAIQESWNTPFASSAHLQFLPRVSGGAMDIVLLLMP